MQVGMPADVHIEPSHRDVAVVAPNHGAMKKQNIATDCERHHSLEAFTLDIAADCDKHDSREVSTTSNDASTLYATEELTRASSNMDLQVDGSLDEVRTQTNAVQTPDKIGSSCKGAKSTCNCWEACTQLRPARGRRGKWTCKKRVCCCCCGCTCTLLLAVAVLLLWAYWACLVLSQHSGGISYVLPPVSQPGAIQRRKERSIRILSYNVFLRPFYVTDEITSEEDDFKDQRLDVFLTLLDDFDVLALQEVWNVCAPQRFQKLIGQAEARGFKHWFRSGCFPLRTKPTDGMLLVLSRHPLHMPGEVIYDACAGIDCIAGKGALAVRIRPFGETMCDFDLLSTHLQAGENHETRQAQMLQMRGFLDEHGSGVESVTTVAQLRSEIRFLHFFGGGAPPPQTPFKLGGRAGFNILVVSDGMF